MAPPTLKIRAEVVGNAAHVDTPDEIPVSGTALVRADYFRTFPDAEFAYLENFGPVRLLVQTSSPYGWEPRP